jgi:L-ascorbate metabolism protein UlaG (beta-lactamase superfamily)
MSLIAAEKKDEALIAEVDALLPARDCFHLWWLGQSGFLLQWNGKRVLFDPYLSDSLTIKYRDTDKPHTRMSELVVNPSLLKKISFVTSSHNHTDHLDADTLKPILHNNPSARFIIPEANRDFVVNRIDCARDFPVGMNDKQSVSFDGITFHGMPAKHNAIERDDAGHCKYMGYVVEFGPYRIYHSGDTLWFDEMIDLLKPFQLDLVILPINGNKPERKVAGNLDATEAATLAKSIGAKMVIPCHYDMFTFNTADVNDFALAAQKLNQPFTILRGGGLFTNN